MAISAYYLKHLLIAQIITAIKCGYEVRILVEELNGF